MVTDATLIIRMVLLYGWRLMTELFEIIPEFTVICARLGAVQLIIELFVKFACSAKIRLMPEDWD